MSAIILFCALMIKNNCSKNESTIDQNVTLSGDLKLLVTICITSNRKSKSEVTGQRTKLYFTYTDYRDGMTSRLSRSKTRIHQFLLRRTCISTGDLCS